MATNPVTIPKVQTTDRNINQLQSNIIPPLNRLLQNVIVNGNVLTGVGLTIGTTTFNHGLGRDLIGWIVIKQNAQAQIYDQQNSNPTPDVTLSLVTNASVVVDLLVF